jgi:formate hydrogenlyase subunit 3/multisubunit Na+/H+ antiporter MnhD subunit
MFSLPLDLLLIFTVASPILGYLMPKQYRGKLLGIYAAVALLITGVALYDLYLSLAENTVIYLPSNDIAWATLRIDALSVFMAFTFIGLGFAATIYSIAYIKNNLKHPSTTP